MRYYTFTDLSTKSYYHRRSAREGRDHAILFFESEAGGPEIPKSEALAAALSIMGSEFQANPRPVLVRAWRREAAEETAYTGWAVSANTVVSPPSTLRSPDATAGVPVTLWYKGAEETVIPADEFAQCTETFALMGACPCPLASTFIDNNYTMMSRCVQTTVVPAFKVIPTDALLRLRRGNDAWYREHSPTKVVDGFTYISGVLLTDRAGFAPSAVGLGCIDPSEIGEARERLSIRATAAAETRRVAKERCLTCVVSRQCAKTNRAKTCGGTRTDEIVVAALKRFMDEFDLRKRYVGFTDQQGTYLMRMGGSSVSGVLPQIRTRCKEVLLGHFGPGSRYTTFSASECVFHVRAPTRGYDRKAVFHSWDELVAALPSVQENFDAFLPELKPLPERVHLLYTLVLQRMSCMRGGFGSRRYLYDVSAHDGGVRYRYAADRWRDAYRSDLDTGADNAWLLNKAYYHVSNDEVMPKYQP